MEPRRRENSLVDVGSHSQYLQFAEVAEDPVYNNRRGRIAATELSASVSVNALLRNIYVHRLSFRQATASPVIQAFFVHEMVRKGEPTPLI